MLMSDAIPVTPIRPIPNERPRQRPNTQINATDDAVRSNRQTSGTQQRRAENPYESARLNLPIGAQDEGPVTAGPVPLSTAPVTGFITQSIHQEAMGPGLHIEPWDTALEAYRKAEAVPYPISRAAAAG